MKSIDEVKGNCRIDDDGCWIWAGGCGAHEIPRIYAPNAAGEMTVQNGRRAVWQMLNPGQSLPNGVQVFGTCGKARCVNPACATEGSIADRGKLIAANGWLKGRIETRLAARATGRARSVLTAEMRRAIDASNEPSLHLARRLGISVQTVSKYRRGQLVCFQPVGGMFTQLTQLGARA